MTKKKIIVTGVLIVGIIAASLAFSFYSKIYASNTKENSSIYIPSNTTFEEVLSLISPKLKNPNSFEWVAKKKNYPNVIKSGKYQINSGMSNNDLVNLLRSGNQTPIKLSFNNQESLEKLAGRIAQQIEPDSLSILNALKDEKFLINNKFTLETAIGMYIPNSYEFYWNTSAIKFRDKMLSEYKRFWTDEKLAKAKKQNLTINGVITLASIVQKETATVSERPRVAGLYLNRYRNKWPLQADPTIIFALKQKLGQDVIIKRVLLKDLEIKSKYNTYKNIGLPPGPISMPDISSINAVLNPENHDYYYMCADMNNAGRHAFAKTLAQHNRNAQKYQRWINEQGINR
ncbi:endolytic transglycosylase MltG [Urechidicola croceus]|uniref:Endolytic murein transglycosylase n=1 Tax=Urechidicola croceus TaxID=1850246 RepID=A0A1D8P3J1_9FLAO|nr:endolytic transglycosylase MltG [Urechidicola croceus]AOW19170.1 aminodeoxychorismate lyase [Urechidicola croceus]